MSNQKIKILLSGATGKMGKLINDFAYDYDCEIIFAVNRTTNLENIDVEKIDLCIDFSSADGLAKIVDFCLKKRLSLISGTTGFDENFSKTLFDSSKKIPILYSSNFSIGIIALKKAIIAAIKVVGNNFDIDIIERHHIDKKDIPSGTAKNLLKTINDLGAKANVHSLRSGNCTGEHEIIFGGIGECFKICHEATDRSVFAHGALSCVNKFLKFHDPKLYSLDEVLSGN